MKIILRAEPWIILYAALITVTLLGVLYLYAHDAKYIASQTVRILERERTIGHLNSLIDELEHQRDDRSDLCTSVLEDNGFIVMEATK